MIREKTTMSSTISRLTKELRTSLLKRLLKRVLKTRTLPLGIFTMLLSKETTHHGPGLFK